MGFRTGAYATIWGVEAKTDTRTQARISISRKNKQTGEYDTDFSGFVDFVGTAAAKKAACLKEKDRIRLGEIDVTNNYVKEKNITYTNFKIFSFETQSEMDNATVNGDGNNFSDPTPANVDSGEVNTSRLPF